MFSYLLYRIQQNRHWRQMNHKKLFNVQLIEKVIFWCCM